MIYHHRTGIGPRERFPLLAGVLPEAHYVAWEQQGVCLCGCGEKPRPPHPRKPEVISYWINGHYPALLKRHGLKKPAVRSYNQRMAASRYNRSQCIDNPAVILGMVREYIDEHHGGSLTRFCRDNGMEHSSLCYNMSGKARLSKRRAKQLLLLIGEKPHPSL